jgi:hypothetical protein
MSAAVWLAAAIAAANTRANFEFGDRAPKTEQRVLPRAEAVIAGMISSASSAASSTRRRFLARHLPERGGVMILVIPRAAASIMSRILGVRMFRICAAVSGSRMEGGAVDADLGEFVVHDEEDRAVTFSSTDWRARVRPPAAS